MRPEPGAALALALALVEIPLCSWMSPSFGARRARKHATGGCIFLIRSLPVNLIGFPKWCFALFSG
jgi:hypothetical protein